MDDLITDFICESREMLQALECELVAWEIDPHDRARLDSIFRFVHTVKGNCGFLDLPKLQALSHAVEDALNDVRCNRRVADRALVDAVLAIIDRIGVMVDAIEAGEGEPSDEGHAALVAALTQTAEDVPVPVAQAATAKTGGSAPSPTHSIRLPVHLVDRVMSGISDMVLVRNELERLLQTRTDDPHVDGAFNRMSGILADLRGAIGEARMQPIAALFSSFQRKIRDLSAELGKQVSLEIESGQVDLDRKLIELVRDPLLHIINNAIDHGIETPAERRAVGKPEFGNLRLSARQTGSEVQIGIIDDGKGIDIDRLVEKAIAQGILDRESAAALSPAERNALVFEPGLSTSDSVSRVSGRGVGMDVVRESIELLGGTIAIETARGEGSRFMLKVPLTLSLVPSITVRVGRQFFALPRSYVLEIIRGGAEAETGRIGGIRQIVVRDEQYPCVGLGEVLGLDDGVPDAKQTMLMVKLISGRVFALGVDAIEGYGELVVKPLALHLMESGLFVGAAQLDDGYPALIIDVAALGEQCGLIEHGGRAFGRRSDADAEVHRQVASSKVLVFDSFAGNRFCVGLGAADRIARIDPATIAVNDGGLHALVGDAVVPLVGVDPAAIPAEAFQALLLTDGRQVIAFAARGVIDTVEVPTDALAGQSIVQIEGRIVELIDCHALFASTVEHRATRARLTCRLPDADRWCQDFLRPLVEASGYCVLSGDEGGIADLEIRTESFETARGPAAQVLTIADEHNEATESGAAIYRYDREAIVGALAAAKAGGRP